MKQEEYKKKIEEQLRELSMKIDQLKIQVVDVKLKERFQKLVKELVDIRENIESKYNLMEKSGDEKWDELSKNIYTDVESFNNAFKEAGKMFKPEKGFGGR